MVKFSKRIANLLFWIITLLGLSALFYQEIRRIGLEIILAIAAVILIAGFVFLVIIKITEFENLVYKIEQKFIREKDLNKIRTDINALKLILLKRK